MSFSATRRPDSGFAGRRSHTRRSGACCWSTPDASGSSTGRHSGSTTTAGRVRGRTARIRVFSLPRQQGSIVRRITIAFHGLDGTASRTAAMHSNQGKWRGVVTDTGTIFGSVPVCVPAHGYADVSIAARGSSLGPGSVDTPAHSFESRRVGVLVAAVGLADELGGRC